MLIGASFCTGFVNTINVKNAKNNISSQKKIYKYPVNKNGQTYGPNIYGSPPGTHPDLLAAIGDHGKKGYILYSQLMETPKNPKEAIAWMKRKSKIKKIPLYKNDGKTSIDTYTLMHK